MEASIAWWDVFWGGVSIGAALALLYRTGRFIRHNWQRRQW